MTDRVIVVVAAKEVAPGGIPVTSKLNEPTGVDADTLTDRTLAVPARVGDMVVRVNDMQDTPSGRGPLQERLTGLDVPPVRVAMIVTIPELPCRIVTGPLFDRE